jgi:hypothetical protein
VHIAIYCGRNGGPLASGFEACPHDSPAPRELSRFPV